MVGATPSSGVTGGAEMSHQRLTAYLHGLVQGVGMRYYVQMQACHLGLQGYVRNLPDGRVEVVAEGPTPALETLVQLLHRPSAGRVTQLETEWTSFSGKWQSFSIAR